MGMDVVRTNVEKIGGKVEIDSRAGKGTTLRLRIPLTLAIIPALIVRSVNQSFALPQGALSELVHIPPEQAAAMIEWIEDAPLYRLRGKLLPLVFLDRLLMPGVACKRVRATATASSRCSMPTAGASAWLSTASPIRKKLSSSRLSAALKDYRPLFRSDGAWQRRSGPDPRSGRDCHEGRCTMSGEEEAAQP